MKFGYLALFVIAAAACGQPSQPAQSATTTRTIHVEVRFDGGYAFVYDNDQLSVASVNHGGANVHPMRMRIHKGTYASLTGDLPPTKAKQQHWDLLDSTYAISVVGQPSGKVTLPASTSTANCDEIGQNEANNSYLLPDIMQLARDAGVSAPEFDRASSHFGHWVNLTDGQLSVERTTSCFELVNQTGSLRSQRFAAGVQAVVVSFTVSGNNLVLALTDGTGSTKNVTVEPYLHPTTGLYVVELGFGRFPPCKDASCLLKAGQELVDFHHYYELLKSPPARDERYIPKLVTAESYATPGDECPPMFFFIQ